MWHQHIILFLSYLIYKIIQYFNKKIEIKRGGRLEGLSGDTLVKKLIEKKISKEDLDKIAEMIKTNSHIQFTIWQIFASNEKLNKMLPNC